MTFSTIGKYFTPAPVYAFVAIYNYKTAKKPSEEQNFEFTCAVNALVATAIAVSAFVASSKLKSLLGSEYNNAKILSSIFLPYSSINIIFAQFFIHCIRGASGALLQRDIAHVTKHVAMGILACMVFSQGAVNLFTNYIIFPVCKGLILSKFIEPTSERQSTKLD